MIAQMRRLAGGNWRRRLGEMSLGYGLALALLFALPLTLRPVAQPDPAHATWQPTRNWSGDSPVLRIGTSDSAREALYAIGASGALYVTLDGALSWSLAPIPLPSSRLGMARVQDLAIHPLDPNQAQIVVASSAERPRPMVYSTEDGGQSWRVESELGPLRVQAMAYGPAGEELYVVTRGYIYRIDWNPAVSAAVRREADLDRFRIASLGVDEEVQAVAIGAWQPTQFAEGERASRYLYLAIKGKGLHILRDDPMGDVSLLPVNEADMSSVYVRERATVHAIYVHPNRPETVCVGTDRGLYATVDGGRTWLPLAYSLRQRSVLALLIDPADNVIYAGVAGGGIVYSADDGATWEQLAEGLRHRSVSAIAVHHHDPASKTLYAGTNDGLWQIDLPTPS